MENCILQSEDVSVETICNFLTALLRKSSEDVCSHLCGLCRSEGKTICHHLIGRGSGNAERDIVSLLDHYSSSFSADAGILLGCLLHSPSLSEFGLDPLGKFLRGESLLICGNSVTSLDQNLRWRIKSDACLALDSLLCDVASRAGIDDHLAAFLDCIRHLVKHICSPVIRNDIEDRVADDHIVFAVYVRVRRECRSFSVLAWERLHIIHLESHLTECLCAESESG